LTALFVPWTKDTVKKTEDTTWEKCFNEYKDGISERLVRHISNINLLQKSKEESRFDRLQRKASLSRATFLDEQSLAEGESDVDTAQGQHGLDMSNEDLVIQAIAERDTPTTDFYMLEAVDACFDHNYFVGGHSQGDVLTMPSTVIRHAMKSLAATPITSVTHTAHIAGTMTVGPSVSIVSDSLESSISKIIQQLTLNTEQTLALRIVAEHANAEHSLDGINQLLYRGSGAGCYRRLTFCLEGLMN
jgi:hypothetical protein